MSGQVLRKVVSDISVEINKIEKDFDNICTIDEVTLAECECCGLREECTQAYIERIKDSYSGKWVCGLCSEAVKEGLKRGSSPVAIEEAVSSHKKFYREFNNSTRLNPKLSFTMAMRSIARRSHENKEKKQYPMSKISRSSSCAPRIDFTMKQS
ncbi:hypothetical protein K7X08_012996 [Anisodus acutangulus]|uniref:Uncharacterized protein n=1 Tax=Anisodus acutangulus TaxID=402998 RepID=A0A9Q1RGG7_9SOLA|nr:hypothetical protein K7X08_012996 [Anisodus acutangulus]